MIEKRMFSHGIRLICLLSVGLPLVLQAQGVSDYKAVRKSQKISGVTNLSRMSDFSGSTTIEIQGTFHGFISGDTGYKFTFITPEGIFVSLSSQSPAEWMKSGANTARIIVEMTRNSQYGSWNGKLLAAMSSDLQAEVVERPAAKAVVTPPPVAPKRAIGSKASRSGSRPAPLEGTLLVAKVEKPSKSWDLPASDALPIYTQFIQSKNRRLSDRDAEEIAQGVIGFSIKYGVDARLIMAVILTESDFKPTTVSRAGAMGLGQLMPVNVRELGISDPFDHMQNLFGTVKLIRGHLDKYSKQTNDPDRILVLSLAGYNAGDGAVRKYGGVPPYRETQNYVKKVMKVYKELAGID
ncbi:MAG: lytic transglycosylase domain-containing protein [Armatimonadetes bacterium]|nr:lytic transglycosylase domain-containing protein [Armatimonadota bacterium]